LPEWLPHRLLNRLHGGDETRIRHGRPRFAWSAKTGAGAETRPSADLRIHTYLQAGTVLPVRGDFGPQTRPRSKHTGSQEPVWQPRVGLVGLGMTSVDAASIPSPKTSR
jgi:hypothetical protein